MSEFIYFSSNGLISSHQNVKLKEKEAENLEECFKLINKIRELDEGSINAWNKSTREFYRQKLHKEWIMKNILNEALIAYKYTKNT